LFTGLRNAKGGGAKMQLRKQVIKCTSFYCTRFFPVPLKNFGHQGKNQQIKMEG